MNLFQQFILAPAALGLLAPLAANAAEVNINDGVSVKAGVFVEGDAVKAATAGSTNAVDNPVTNSQADRTGYMIETTFSF